MSQLFGACAAILICAVVGVTAFVWGYLEDESYSWPERVAIAFGAGLAAPFLIIVSPIPAAAYFLCRKATS